MVQRLRRRGGGARACVHKQGPAPYAFDRVAVREDIRHGQRLEKFAVEARTGGNRQPIAEGTTIGHRRIRPLATPVTATAVRVKVLESRATPHPGAMTPHLSTAP
ncbi:hypothetical protein ACFU9X_26565 [Streptomyces atratus]|uniref:hypothetical protein n=1 Tax=Streptomyces atratus TaxID=1893 RepID=UPI0036C83A9F